MSSATLSFLPWARSGPQPWTPRVLHVAGWNRDRTAFLVYSEGGERTALRLHLPALPGMSWLNAEALFSSTPAAIRRTVLRLPPCRETLEEAEAVRRFGPSGVLPSGKVPELWESAAVTVLHLTPEDDAPLRRLLRAYQVLARKDIEARLASGDGMPPAGRTRRTREAQSELQAVNQATLVDVRAGAFGIRDRYLREEWAKLVGLDLTQVDRDASSFRHWLPLLTRPERLTEDALAALEAGVRYEVSFPSGGRVWLGEVEEVCPPEARDTEDFGRMEAAVDVAGAESVTRDQCRRELGGITERRLRQICKEYGVKVPGTRRQLDALVARHNRRRRHNSSVLRARNQARAGQARLP